MDLRGLLPGSEVSPFDLWQTATDMFCTSEPELSKSKPLHASRANLWQHRAASKVQEGHERTISIGDKREYCSYQAK